MPPESPSSLLFLFKEETIPHVTVLERDMGLPTATTHSPGRSDADEPSAIKGRFVYNKPSSHRETNVCSYMYCLRHNYHWATCTFTCTSRDDAKPWYSTQWLLQFPVGHHLAFHSLLVQDCIFKRVGQPETCLFYAVSRGKKLVTMMWSRILC